MLFGGAAVTAVALLLLEIVLRAGLYEALSIPIEAPMFTMRDDGRIGLRPNVSLRSRGGEWDVPVVTNRHGLRDLDRPPSESAYRILGLGDSFTFAWGVPMETGYLACVEDILRRQTGEEIQVFKSAVPGWGPGDELTWLRENWDRLRPQLLLLGFVAGNDYYDTMVGGASQYVVVEGIQIPKIRNRGFYAPFRGFLRRHSILFRAVAALSSGVEMELALRTGKKLQWRSNEIFLRELPGETRAAVDSTLTILDDIHELARSRGAKFAVVVVPSRAQVHDEDYQLFKRRFGFHDEDLDMERPQREISSWAARSGVPLLDLAPEMKAAAARDNTRLYFRNDSHWTIAGHRLAGDLVAAFLMQQGLSGR